MLFIIVNMKRTYESTLRDSLSSHEQMLFIVGPRQVGKTTLSKSLLKLGEKQLYLNWDNTDHREWILKGPGEIAKKLGLDVLSAGKTVLVLDEFHKYKEWKNFLKGFYDMYKGRVLIVVTGSANMDFFKSSGDSLMGRYFPYRVHPLSVGELCGASADFALFKPPQTISDAQFDRLLNFGGFPDPYLKNNRRFYNRWMTLRRQQLFKEDLRELSNVQELGQMELLAQLLTHQIAQLTTYASLAKKIGVSISTVKRWIGILRATYFCFELRPWHKNIARSLLKEPKYYLWDWSICKEKGARNENFIASHLLKSVHFWNDTGEGHFGLYFIRDKEKREVDFLITKEDRPWIMVEVKSSKTPHLSPALKKFHEDLNPMHTFQVAIDMPYVDTDVFRIKQPMIVPARTFLSQLR